MDRTIKVFTSQRNAVMDIINTENEYFVNKKFIERKYEESYKVFINVYEWFNTEATKIVEKPKEADSGIWVFKDANMVDQHSFGTTFLNLNVPKDKIILFNQFDFTAILNGRYLTVDKKEEDAYNELLIKYGVKQKSDVYTTNFYPELKRTLFKSWKNLFNHHNDMLANKSSIQTIQGCIWSIKKDYII